MTPTLVAPRNLIDQSSGSLIAPTPSANMLVAIAPNVARAEVLLAGVSPDAEVLRLRDDEDYIA